MLLTILYSVFSYDQFCVFGVRLDLGISYLGLKCFHLVVLFLPLGLFSMNGMKKDVIFMS